MTNLNQDAVIYQMIGLMRSREMNIWQFATHSPWLTFFLAIIAGSTIKFALAMLINRPLRHMNIRKHGWPPAHCDADGDFKQDKDEGEK